MMNITLGHTKKLDDILLTPNQRQALNQIRQCLYTEFHAEAVVLFGSVARGDADDESDIDLLVILPQPFTHEERHKITDMVFYVNLAHDTNFSTLVIDRDNWQSGVVSVLPIKQEIVREGILL